MLAGEAVWDLGIGRILWPWSASCALYHMFLMHHAVAHARASCSSLLSVDCCLPDILVWLLDIPIWRVHISSRPPSCATVFTPPLLLAMLRAYCLALCGYAHAYSATVPCKRPHCIACCSPLPSPAPPCSLPLTLLSHRCCLYPALGELRLAFSLRSALVASPPYCFSLAQHRLSGQDQCGLKQEPSF